MRQSRWPRVPTAEHREPCESRGSRTVLGSPGGAIPPGDSTKAEKARTGTKRPVCLQKRIFYLLFVRTHPSLRHMLADDDW